MKNPDLSSFSFSSQKIRSGSSWRKSLHMMLFSLTAVFLGLGMGFVYHHYLTFVPEGAAFWGHDLSGLNRADAEQIVTDLVDDWEQSSIVLDVKREDTVVPQTFPVKELGFNYDVSATVDRMMNREFFSADLMHGAADTPVVPVVYIQENLLTRVLDRVVEYEEAPQSAQLYLDESEQVWQLREHKLGYGFDVQQQLHLAQELRQLAVSGGGGTELEVELEVLEPEVTSGDLEALYAEVESSLNKTVQWPADGEMVVFSVREYPWVLDVDQDLGVVSVSQAALEKFVEEYAQTYNREAGKVLVGEPVEQERGYLRSSFEGEFLGGRTLDQADMVQKLMTALQQTAEEPVQIELQQESSSTVLELWDGQQLSFLSQGRSSYALAHSEDRLYNVKFGLSKYDGVVIPQGAEFSFNQVLGWVTYEAGWKPALAIFGGGGVKPVPGGGLCQVSTTFYRAIVHEGLPVTARKPHSLDVSYYHEYGYGIDSTIYPPEDIDLKFVNDTPGPIVVHTYVDEAREEAFVEFYGIDDGREVVLEQVTNRPVILPKQTSVDPSLPAGKEVIDSLGRVGRYIEWSWKIIGADGTVQNKAIETLYPASPKRTRIGG